MSVQDPFCPFSVQVDDKRGRFLTCNKEVKPGEVIFQERPLILGPCGVSVGEKEKSKRVSTCLGCYKIVSSHYKCSKCGWPVCSHECEIIPDHSNFECKVFADCPVSPITSPHEYERIRILRCLLLKEQDPDKWKLLLNLESHSSLRKENVLAVSSDISCYKFIKEECHLKQFPFNDIHHCAGVLAINSYNQGPNDTFASFLFYYSSLLAHNCVPNARAIIQTTTKGKSYLISVIATTRIRVGEMITTSYVEPHLVTMDRRASLLDNFYFSCECGRCRDPMEMGSYLSAIKCVEGGWLLPKDALNPSSEWICNQLGCDTVVPVNVISSIVQDIKGKMIKIGHGGININVQELHGLLEQYRNKVLHKNHYLVISMELEVLRLLDTSLEKVKDEEEVFHLAKWKVELSRHCLSVADLIQPGHTKIRGHLLYILQDALLTICTFRVNQCSDTKELEFVRKKYKKQFAEALEIMKEAKSILILEPIGSKEWEKGTLLSLEEQRIKFLKLYLSFKD